MCCLADSYCLKTLAAWPAWSCLQHGDIWIFSSGRVIAEVCCIHTVMVVAYGTFQEIMWILAFSKHLAAQQSS